MPRAVPPARRLPGGCLLPAALGLAGPCHAGEAAAAGGTLTEGLIVGGGLFLLLAALTVLTLLFFMWGLITSLNDILVPHLKAVAACESRG